MKAPFQERFNNPHSFIKHMAKEIYDTIIIGSGPAGLSSATYSSRYRLKTLVLGVIAEGQAARAHLVQNYPGIKEISGFDLVLKMKEQAESCGAIIKEESVKRIEKEKDSFKVTAENTYYGKTIVLAMGTKRRTLNVSGEEKFRNKGISYCAVCDAPLFKGKDVAVVGCSESAFASASLLSKYASSVTMICRSDSKACNPIKDKKIRTICNTEIVEAFGNKFLEGIKLGNGAELKINGLFVEIGSVPSAELASGIGVSLAEDGSIKVNAAQETSVKGVYAAGDVTKGASGFKQIISAASEGAAAAKSGYAFLNKGALKLQWG